MIRLTRAHGSLWLVLLWAGAAAGAVAQTSQSPEPQPAEAEQTPDPAVEPPEVTTAADAARERVFEALAPPIQPTRTVGTGSDADERLLRDGVMLVQAPGTLVSGEKRTIFRLNGRGKQTGEQQFRVLPSRLLEAVEQQTQPSSDYLVTGEVTRYGGENYLLLRRVVRVSTPAAATASADQPVDTPITEAPVEPPPAATQPADSPAGFREPEHAQMFRELLARRDGRPILPRQPRAPVRTADLEPPPPAQRRSLELEGTMLLTRTGTARRTEDGTVLFEYLPPGGGRKSRIVRVLPNPHREELEKLLEAESADVTVTGEITVYEGENYLLLRSLSRKIAHGNLHP